MVEELNPSATWKPLHDRFYRKFELYDTGWDSNTDLSGFIIASARYGGPMAFIRNPHELIPLSASGKPMARKGPAHSGGPGPSLGGIGGSTAPRMYIYSAAGRKISSWLWEVKQGQGKLVGMGWSDSELLVVALDNGAVRCYSLHGQLVKTFTLASVLPTGAKVVDVKFWGGGAVVMTSVNTWIAIPDYDAPRPVVLANPNLSDPPTAWTIMEPSHTLSRTVEVLVATRTGTILVVDGSLVQDQLLTNGPFRALEVSPNGRLLACFTDTGNLWVVVSDFSKNLSEFGTKSKTPPRSLCWCGADSVVLHWDGVVLVVGPFGDWIKYSYDTPLVLMSESDGVRVLTPTKMEFLELVPAVTQAVFGIGSTAPSALLYDALKAFESKSPKADDNIRRIKNDLPDAVEALITAAQSEYDPSVQKRLLRAASFGKTFLDFYPPDKFVTAARTLRVLNAVRHYTVGLPLTVTQYQALTPQVLLDRLVHRHHHFLAFRVAGYLQLKPVGVLLHWACVKVRGTGSHESIRDAIVDKLKDTSGVPWVDIAQAANDAGKPELAIMLLDYEPRSSEQVPLLLTLKRDDLALEKAIRSGDTDLVYYVLFHVKEHRSQDDFFALIRGKRLAVDLFMQYAKERDPGILQSFWSALSMIESAASSAFRQAYDSSTLQDRMLQLERSQTFFAEAKSSNSPVAAAAPFLAKSIGENIELLKQQADMQSKVGKPLLEHNVSDTLRELLRLGHDKQASNLKSKMKVPDKRWMWLRLRARADARDWEGLEKLAKERSPIGYGPFVEATIKYQAFDQAAKYIPKVSDTVLRSQYWFTIGRFLEAAELAASNKDLELLAEIKGKTNRREVLSIVDPILAKAASQ